MFLERFFIGNLWNAALICVMLGLKCLMQNRVSLRFQHYSWYVLIASLLLPFFPGGLWNGWPSAAQSTSQTIAAYNLSASNTVAANHTPWIEDTAQLMIGDAGSVQIEFGILAVWFAGVLILLAFYWCGGYRLRQVQHFAMLPSKNIQDLFDECCQKLKIRKNVQVRQSRFITAPVSFGWKKPVVVLPNRGIEKLPASDLENVILHELTHIRHGDLITNYLFCGMQALYWLNPLVWLAFRQMRRDREAYCDWAVLNELSDENARIAYGQTILNFAAGCQTQFHTANGLCQNKEQLKYRLEQIVGYQKDTAWRKTGGRCLTGVLALLCLFQIPALAFCVEDSGDYYVPSDSISMSEGDWDTLSSDIDGCAVVYDLNADHYTVYNENEITHRVPPCSTFKIYSALNALEQGIISPVNNTLSWDGNHREFAVWNQNHNLSSAMQQSANWYFQSMDQTAGVEQLSQFYRGINYGNTVIGSDAASYWNGSALKISALEQVELLVKLYNNSWGFNAENVAAVQNAMLLSASGDTALYGKTGTGRIDSTNIAGWFVGYVEQSGNTYFFAVYLCADTGTDGTAATQIAMDILDSMDIKVNIPEGQYK